MFRRAANAFRRKNGFTLIEALITVGLVGVAAAGTFAVMGKINEFASVSRLYTCASTIAQNQIDHILSDSPFNPSFNPPQIPAVLTTDASRGGPLVQTNVPINTDPVSNQVVVTGTLTTSVVDTSMTQNGSNLNIYRATVTVGYRFKNRSYTVVMSTMRTSDI